MKSETLDEFIARGGKIEKIPSVEPETKDIIRKTTTGPATIHTLSEGELLFAEKSKRKKKKKKTVSDEEFAKLMEDAKNSKE